MLNSSVDATRSGRIARHRFLDDVAQTAGGKRDNVHQLATLPDGDPGLGHADVGDGVGLVAAGHQVEGGRAWLGGLRGLLRRDVEDPPRQQGMLSSTLTYRESTEMAPRKKVAELPLFVHDVGMTSGTGRREANKMATRAALMAAATSLFAQQGYEATTVAQIADAAGVGERTFYRYFEGKDELLASKALKWIDALHVAIRERPAVEPAFVAVARATTEMTSSVGARRGSAVGLVFSEAAGPVEALRRVSPRPLRRLEAAIADAVSPRMVVGSGGWPRGATGELRFHAELVARVAVAVLRTAVITHRQLAEEKRSPGLALLIRQGFADLPPIVANGADDEA